MIINQPLYLPKGSVQAILALATTIFIFVAVLLGVSIPDFIFVTWAGMVGLYFGNRGNQQEQKQNE